MFTTLMVVLPIFALILAGYVARRSGLLGPHSTTELNRFVVYLALPALLFDIMAHTSWAALYQPGFIGAFGLSSAAIFLITLALRLRAPRHLADASIDGLNAGYANTGFIGLPLCLVVFGRDSMAEATIATIIIVCVLFAVAIVLIELGLQGRARPAALAVNVGRALVRNPLVMSPLAGALWSGAGLGIPLPAESFLKLLGGAASPCALVALGLFLAQQKKTSTSDTLASLLFVALKLVGQPVIAWVLATAVFHLPPLATHVTVVLAALPTGTGPFMLAEFYRREAAVTSNAILLSTIGSVVTVSAYLAWVS